MVRPVRDQGLRPKISVVCAVDRCSACGSKAASAAKWLRRSRCSLRRQQCICRCAPAALQSLPHGAFHRVCTFSVISSLSPSHSILSSSHCTPHASHAFQPLFPACLPANSTLYNPLGCISFFPF